MKDPAPIGLSTYTRLDHLKQTIEALKANELAEQSRLYIFSDAPRTGDEQSVEAIRAYAATISGFRHVHVLERERNNRTANNRGGMMQLLNNYGRMIFLEEDIVTSPYFLTFMNEALEMYKDVDDVISVSGYCPPIRIPYSHNKDVFLLKRFNAWGFGTWKHKFDPFSFTISKEEYLKKKNIIYDELDNYGKDVKRMVDREVKDELDALDVKVMYHQVLHNLYTLYPVVSLTNNIGHDGSGLHCGTTMRYDVKLAQSKIKVELLREESEDIVKENRQFRNQTGKYFFKRIINKVKKEVL